LRQVVITAGEVAIRARLLDTPTAERIWNALPIYGAAKTWGKEVYFHAPVSHGIEPGARDVVTKGEIAFWPDGDAIAIGFGATPLSKRGEIRFTSPCNVWAVALDDVDQLRRVYAGEAISVVEANTAAPWQATAQQGDGQGSSSARTMHAGACPNDDSNI
jgi:hypothetical protein